MLVVVPAEEGAAEGPGVLQGAESVREAGVVFERLELGLRVGIVVADLRPAVGLVILKSIISSVTVFEVMAAPRSA